MTDPTSTLPRTIARAAVAAVEAKVPVVKLEWETTEQLVARELDETQRRNPELPRARCVGLLEAEYRDRLKALDALFRKEFLVEWP